MSETEPIDLSVLDPMRDPERWSRFAEATRDRVERALDPIAIVGGWGRVILAAAAVFMILVGGTGIFTAKATPRGVELSDARRLALLTEGSMSRGEAPTGAELLAALRARGHR